MAKNELQEQELQDQNDLRNPPTGRKIQLARGRGGEEEGELTGAVVWTGRRGGATRSGWWWCDEVREATRSRWWWCSGDGGVDGAASESTGA